MLILFIPTLMIITARLVIAEIMSLKIIHLVGEYLLTIINISSNVIADKQNWRITILVSGLNIVTPSIRKAVANVATLYMTTINMMTVL